MFVEDTGPPRVGNIFVYFQSMYRLQNISAYEYPRLWIFARLVLENIFFAMQIIQKQKK